MLLDSIEMGAIHTGCYYHMPTCVLKDRCFLVIRSHRMLQFGILLEVGSNNFAIGDFFVADWTTEELEKITADRPLQSYAAQRGDSNEEESTTDFARLFDELGAQSQFDFHRFAGCLVSMFAEQDRAQPNKLSELHQTAIANEFFTLCQAAEAFDVCDLEEEIQSTCQEYGTTFSASGDDLETYRNICVELGVKVALSHFAKDS